MVRTLAQLPKGSRISDHIRLGVIARRGHRDWRGVKRKMSSFPVRPNGPPRAPIPDSQEHIKIRN